MSETKGEVAGTGRKSILTRIPVGHTGKGRVEWAG